MSEPVDTLVRCWAEWDKKPGNEDRAGALGLAAAAVAGPLGVQPNLLIATIQGLRRDGLRVRDAVTTAVEGFASR